MNAKVTYRLFVWSTDPTVSQSIGIYQQKQRKTDSFENVLVSLVTTMNWMSEKKSQLTLKKDKQHMIAITNQTFLFISDNFGHWSCSDILNLKLVWNSKGLKTLGQSYAVRMA